MFEWLILTQVLFIVYSFSDKFLLAFYTKKEKIPKTPKFWGLKSIF